MATWIEPLEMQTFFVNVLSGSTDVFTAIAIVTIMAMAGFFRMSMLVTFLIFGLFFMMFSTVINFEIYFIVLALAAMLIGNSISKIVR